MSTSVPPPNMPEREPVPFELPRPPRRIPPRVKFLGAVAAVAAAVVIGLIAFGGGPGPGGFAPVAQAATVSTGEPGFTMRMTLSMNIGALPTPVTMTGSGVFDAPDHAGALSMSMDTANVPGLGAAFGSGGFSIREIIRGTSIYMKLPPALMARLPLGGKQWLGLDLAKIPGLSGLSSLLNSPASSNPTSMMQTLRGVSGVVTMGHDEVDGVSTTHYSGQIDLSRVSSMLPANQRAALKPMLSMLEQEAHLSELPVNVWIDSQHLVRRMQMSISTTAAGIALNETMTLDIPHYGPEPAPAAPAASQVQDMSSLLSGLGTGGVGGSLFG